MVLTSPRTSHQLNMGHRDQSLLRARYVNMPDKSHCDLRPKPPKHLLGVSVGKSSQVAEQFFSFAHA